MYSWVRTKVCCYNTVSGQKLFGFLRRAKARPTYTTLHFSNDDTYIIIYITAWYMVTRVSGTGLTLTYCIVRHTVVIS